MNRCNTRSGSMVRQDVYRAKDWTTLSNKGSNRSSGTSREFAPGYPVMTIFADSFPTQSHTSNLEVFQPSCATCHHRSARCTISWSSPKVAYKATSSSESIQTRTLDLSSVSTKRCISVSRWRQHRDAAHQARRRGALQQSQQWW